MAQRIVCNTCGSIGYSKRILKGSFIVELVLWFGIPILCFGLFLTPAGLLLAILGPIYTTWRWATSYKGCSKCSGRDVIPADSPVARKILSEEREKGKAIPSDENSKQDVVAKLEKLAELKQKGVLTDEEFQAQKRKLFSS
jgi:hypothetical protein